MKIYIVQHGKYGQVLGAWTDPDELANMVGTLCGCLGSPSGETALQEFRDNHHLRVYEDGVIGGNKFVPWSEIFPTE